MGTPLPNPKTRQRSCVIQYHLERPEKPKTLDAADRPRGEALGVDPPFAPVRELVTDIFLPVFLPVFGRAEGSAE